MRLRGIVFVAVFFTAVAAYPKVTRQRVNENCENRLELGLDTTGGNANSLNFVSGLKVCNDNLKRRLALEGEALVVKRDTTERNHKLEGAYDYRFGEGWLAILQASHESDSADHLQSRVVVAPGIGLERFPTWGTLRVGAGLGRTWEDNRDAEPTSFPEVWGQTVVRWKVRPNINFREKFDAFFETRDDTNYWYRSDSEFQFSFTEHFSLATNIVYKWDHQPARNAARSSWITRTRFVFTWGGDKR